MRISYRNKGHRDYWEQRWQGLPIDVPMRNTGIYPLKYALLATGKNSGPILEAGCGAGRVLRYFHERGDTIYGCDYVASVIEKLRESDSSLHVESANITNLPYADGQFCTVLAFGLLHNLPLEAARKGLLEMRRVLRSGGRVCISYRADNLQNRLNDY